MPDAEPPDFREKRRILYSTSTPDEDRRRAAREFLDAERFGEALEVLEKVADADLLSRIEREGIERGDTFFLLRVEKLRGQPVTPDAWRRAAAAAEAKGRLFDAYRAYERAGDPEKAKAVLPDYQPFRPEGKQS
jgi:hypothetical protein